MKRINQRYFDRRFAKGPLYHLIFSNVDEFEHGILQKNLEGNSDILTIAFHSCKNIHDNDLEFLQTLPSLNHVYVYNTTLSGDFLRYLRNVKELNLEIGYTSFQSQYYNLLK